MVSARCVPLAGGIETHVNEVAPRLARRGIDLTVLTTDLAGTLPAREERDGFVIRRFAASPASGDYYFSPDLARALRAADFDLVHVQGVHTLLAPLALHAAQRASVPTILTFHTGGSSSVLRNLVRGVQWRAEAPLLRRARRLVAVCDFEIERFSRALGLPRDRFELIRNGAEALPTNGPGAPAAVPSGASPLVLSIGRLERYKGHHRVIAAMPEMRRRAPRAHLVVVGGGPYEPKLLEQVHQLDLSGHVTFATFAPHERAALGSLVVASDVVALLSDYEAHPVTVMEALALGRDVVVADTSGLSELGRAGLATVVELEARPERVAEVILHAAGESRWSSGPPPISSWDDCAARLALAYEGAAS